MANRAIGETVSAKVVKILESGAIVSFEGGTAFLHISELSTQYVKQVTDIVQLNQKIDVLISSRKGDKTFVSLKNVKTEAEKKVEFEDRIKKFLEDSNENLREIQKSQDRKRGLGQRNKKLK